MKEYIKKKYKEKEKEEKKKILTEKKIWKRAGGRKIGRCNSRKEKIKKKKLHYKDRRDKNK